MRNPRLFTLLVLFSVAGGCAFNPNEYRSMERGFGYDGKIPWKSQINEGYVVFMGDTSIAPELLREHCLRRAAELAFAAGFDYIWVKGNYDQSGQGKEHFEQWMGNYTDAYGRKYARYRVGDKTVPTKGRLMEFLAYRGPVPAAGDGYLRCRDILMKYHGSYGGRSFDDPAATACVRCGKPAREVTSPEQCAACGENLYNDILCPHCVHRFAIKPENAVIACPSCAKKILVAYCRSCDGRNVLGGFRPFRCAFCGAFSETGVASGNKWFDCPRCRKSMGWPAGGAGNYTCPECRGGFVVDACDLCGALHALDQSKPFTCWECGNWNQ